jgi:hypothetical protein
MEKIEKFEDVESWKSAREITKLVYHAGVILNLEL